MRKLLVTLALAGTLSLPSVVFAEASWYGSLRGGIEFSGGETNFYDGASRWGIKGSAEASEGLTAVYRFEHSFSTTDGSQPGGRLGYVGLSGGFGSITLGQQWSASYNHAGVIRDFPNWYTASDTSGRVPNALSYAVSTDAFSLQIDAIMDGKKDTNKAVDQMEFGMTVNLGEIGKVAFAHTNKRDTMKTGIVEAAMPAVPATPDTYWVRTTDNPEGGMSEAKMITVYLTGAQNIEDNVVDGKLTNPDGLALVTRTGNRYHSALATAALCTTAAETDDTADDCATAIAFVAVTKADDTVPAGGGTPVIGATREFYLIEGPAVNNVVKKEGTPAKAAVPAVMGPVLDERGHKASHISAQFGLGAVTAALGYSEQKVNGASGKTKTTFVGAKGSIGDTGLDWGAYSRVKKNANGTENKPWTIGLSKSLGGGAWTYIEHGNDGDKGSTAVALGVNF